jgi:hypothetical protein
MLRVDMAANKSTRLNIVTQSLHDSLERLRDMPATARVRELRTKAQAYERAVRQWSIHPPSEEQRQAMVKLVIEMNMEVMALRKATAE